MSAVQTMEAAPPVRAASVLTVGFGTTVAMWAVGYLGRLPVIQLPSPLLLVLLLATLFAGGAFLGQRTAAGWPRGALVGLVSGLLNLLVLGSFLGGDAPNRVTPSALWWVPLSIVVCALLASAGAWVGSRAAARPTPDTNWPAAFVRVAVAATFLLLAVGGLVTSAQAGLAVVDWPNSFGYNMFLYPFSRMTGGIYYEHAHRLFGALVGLTTLILALFLQRVDERGWVRRLAWLALAMVVVQGLLGGLRVTGRLTLSTSETDMAPNLVLAAVHGVFGQVFFGTLVALAVFTSTTWRNPPAPLRRKGVASDRGWAIALVAVIVAQLVLGATLRHTQQLLLVHMVTGMAIVTPLALNVGIRAWGLNKGQTLLQRLGLALVIGIAIQIVLGFIAFVVTRAAAEGTLDPLWDLTLATTHQWFGALLLGVAVALACWNYRLLEPGEGSTRG